MSFVSHAQNLEDVMLWRALRHVERGFYVDVGASDPEAGSVTKTFYDRGWRGINIEPVSQWFQRLEHCRPRDINLQVAAGAAPGEAQMFEISDSGLSTLVESIADMHKPSYGDRIRRTCTKVVTLSQICRQYHVAPIHFMSIDVEGSERQVLEGLDLSEIRPWIIVVEATQPNSQTETSSGWAPILLGAGYESVYFDGLNRFFVAEEREGLARCFENPPNVFDDFVFAEMHAYSRPTIELLHAERSKCAEETLGRQRLQEEADALRHQSKQLEENLQETHNLLMAAREERERTVAALTKAVEALEKGLEEKQFQSEHLRAKLQELQSHADYWRTLADRVDQHLQAVYSSTSWRITAPMRSMKTLLSRWTGGDSPKSVLPTQLASNGRDVADRQDIALSDLTPAAAEIYTELKRALSDREERRADSD